MAVKYHHGNLREALIAEGAKLLEEKGIESVTLREIGDRAGVSRTASYRHFADKAELLHAISEAGFTEFGNALEASIRELSGKKSFAARLNAMGRAYLKFAAERRAYYEVMFGGTCAGDGPASARAFTILEGLIRSGQASGDVRAGDPEPLAKFVWAQVHGLATLHLEIDFDLFGDLLRNGLREPGERR